MSPISTTMSNKIDTYLFAAELINLWTVAFYFFIFLFSFVSQSFSSSIEYNKYTRIRRDIHILIFVLKKISLSAVMYNVAEKDIGDVTSQVSLLRETITSFQYISNFLSVYEVLK